MQFYPIYHVDSAKRAARVDRDRRSFFSDPDLVKSLKRTFFSYLFVIDK